MKSMVAVGGKLAIICIVAAVILGFVNAVTEPVIIENKKEQLQHALEQVSGSRPIGERVDVPDNPVVKDYYPLKGPEGGKILELIGTGYGGDMQILAGYNDNGEIFSVILMDNQETPGLGKKAEDPAYMKKYIGTGTDEHPVPLRKDQLPQAEADAVTGASITFMGLANALNTGAEFVKEIGETK